MASAASSGGWQVLMAILFVFGGCQVNMYFLEIIVRDPAGRSMGTLLTFLQFAGVATLAWLCFMVDRTQRRLPSLANLRRVRPLVLDQTLLWTVAAMFYVTSVTNNLVYAFGLTVPFHTVFRSVGLVVNMAVGRIARGQRYSLAHYVCAVFVSAGVAALTIVQHQATGHAPAACGTGVPCHGGQHVGGINITSSGGVASAEDVWTVNGAMEALMELLAHTDSNFWMGIGVLFTTTVVAACLGVVQDALFGKLKADPAAMIDQRSTAWQEAAFFSHAMPIPFFLAVGLCSSNRLIGGDMIAHIASIPQHLWAPIAANVISQFVCICGVYTLLAATSAFTMTLTITFRKFLSLVVSIVAFGHYTEFSLVHYLGLAAVVLGGSIAPFLPRVDRPQQSLKPSENKSKTS